MLHAIPRGVHTHTQIWSQWRGNVSYIFWLCRVVLSPCYAATAADHWKQQQQQHGFFLSPIPFFVQALWPVKQKLRHQEYGRRGRRSTSFCDNIIVFLFTLLNQKESPGEAYGHGSLTKQKPQSLSTVVSFFGLDLRYKSEWLLVIVLGHQPWPID